MLAVQESTSWAEAFGMVGVVFIFCAFWAFVIWRVTR